MHQITLCGYFSWHVSAMKLIFCTGISEGVSSEAEAFREDLRTVTVNVTILCIFHYRQLTSIIEKMLTV